MKPSPHPSDALLQTAKAFAAMRPPVVLPVYAGRSGLAPELSADSTRAWLDALDAVDTVTPANQPQAAQKRP